MSVTLTPLQQSDREQFILDNQESFVERVNRLSLFFSFFASHLNLGDGVRGSVIYIDLVFRDEYGFCIMKDSEINKSEFSGDIMVPGDGDSGPL